jgi:signal transduction histidine kinase
MVTDVAHELRTPLTNIRGYLEALRDGVARPDPALLGSLHDESLLLSRLVDDLQDLALAEAGQLQLAPRPIALAPIVELTVGALRPALAERELTIGVELPADLPRVAADPARVGQVLRNLLNNALTHTPPGGHIVVTATTIQQQLTPDLDKDKETGRQGDRETRRQGDKATRRQGDSHHTSLPVAQSPSRPVAQSVVAVSVRDSGSGIAAEHLPNIFERFYRVDRSRSRATGGAGLGLAIVRQLVQAHGGCVWAESPPGAGAVFTFTLPICSR